MVRDRIKLLEEFEFSLSILLADINHEQNHRPVTVRF